MARRQHKMTDRSRFAVPGPGQWSAQLGEPVVPRGRAKPVRPIALGELLATTERRLRDLLVEFEKPEAAYPSNKIPKAGRRYPGDYDHLARISEWIATDQEDEDFVPVS